MLGLGLGLNRYRKVGGASFSLTDIASLEAWYDATDESNLLDASGGAISNGEEVGTLVDLSSNGFYLTKDGGTTGPTWSTSAVGSFSGLVFDGVLKKLINSDAGFNFSQANTILICFKHSNVGSGARIVFDSTNTPNRHTLYINTLIDRQFSSTDLEIESATTDLKLYTLIYNAGNSIARKNGLQVVTGNAGNFPIQGLTIGSAFNSGAAFDGIILEMAIFSTQLTGDDLTNAETYFLNKYSL